MACVTLLPGKCCERSKAIRERLKYRYVIRSGG